MNINAVIQPAGFVLPVSLQLFDMLMAEAGDLPASGRRSHAVTLNFRDPDYSGVTRRKSGWFARGMSGAWTTPWILATSAAFTSAE